MIEARWYKKIGKNIVCNLCPKTCVFKENEIGDCKVRKRIGNKLYSLNYGRIIAMNLDPIEKKPLFHFYPNSKVLSIALPGCNLHCKFCQNWEISQEFEFPSWFIEPEYVVEKAIEINAEGIAYTYSEPTIFAEYALDVAKIAKKEGLFNVWISNGYTSKEALKDIIKYIDAANIDWKSYDDEFYRKIAFGLNAKIPFETIKYMHEHNIHVEVTTLIIPGYNENSVENIAKDLSKLDKNIPYHISRFHPDYLMKDLPPTPIETMNKAYEIARKHLNYVYVGNLFSDERESTYCPKCGTKLIERIGFVVSKVNLEEKEGKYYCKKCGEEIPIKGHIIE